MQTLKKTADNCRERADETDKNFGEWLLYATELYAACVGAQSSDEDKIKAIAISLVVEQSRLDSQNDTSAEAKAASDNLGKKLDVTLDVFKKVRDNFPPG